MNKTLSEAIQLVNGINALDYDQQVQLILVPPFPYLDKVVGLVNSGVEVGAQNCSAYDKGAYTGEVAASMVRSVGAKYVIIGHSERRTYFKETNKELSLKTDQALLNGLIPIYCCGELLEQRNENEHFNVIEQQVSEGLFHLSREQILNCVIAYEPVWAIGTGVTATPDQAQEIHAYIRELLTRKYGQETAESISILYGGSCNPKNARELFALPDVDGGLIGGASLVAEDFIAIANSF